MYLQTVSVHTCVNISTVIEKKTNIVHFSFTGTQEKKKFETKLESPACTGTMHCARQKEMPMFDSLDDRTQYSMLASISPGDGTRCLETGGPTAATYGTVRSSPASPFRRNRIRRQAYPPPLSKDHPQAYGLPCLPVQPRRPPFHSITIHQSVNHHQQGAVGSSPCASARLPWGTS